MQSLFCFFYCVGLSCDDAACDAEPLSRRSIRACAVWSAACLAQQWSSVEVCDRWALPASTSYIWLTALNMALSHGQAEIRQPSIWFYLCDDTSCVILPFSWSQIYVCLNCSCLGYCCHANQTVFEIIIQQWETQNMHLLTLHAVTPKISPSQMFGDRSTEHLSLNRHDVKRTWIVFCEEFRDINKAVTSIWQIEVEKEQTWVLTTQRKKHVLVRLLKWCAWERSSMLSNINFKSGQMPCEKKWIWLWFKSVFQACSKLSS